MDSIPITTITDQNLPLRTDILAGLSHLFETNEWTYGSETVSFEKAFAKLTQTKSAVAVSSGTMSLWATFRALKLQPDDEVITTPMTFSATADAVVLAGGKPVFADVDPLTGNLDPVAAAKVITKKTKAILVVHLYGVPVDVSAFQKLAKKHRIFLIEDASHAHGATYKGKSVGSFGLAGCFSLYPSKSLGALGNGGIVVTKFPSFAKKIRQAAHHGMITQYRHTSIGLNGLMDNFQALGLNRKLPFLQSWLVRKRTIAAYYDAALAAVGQMGMPITPQTAPSYYTYAIRVPNRAAFRAWCSKQGIETRIYYPIPLHLQPSYAFLGYKKGAFPHAEYFAKHTVSVPLFPGLTDVQIKRVATALQKYWLGRKT
jgi:dTDP-4-amino-4,6-dideoxygalactose transaminase